MCYMMVTRRLGCVDATQTRASLWPRLEPPTFWLFPFSLLFSLVVMPRFSPCCVAFRFLPKLVSEMHPSPCRHASSQSYVQLCLFRGRVLTLFPRGGPGLVLRVGTPGKTHPSRPPFVNLYLSWTRKRTLPVLGTGMASVLHPLPLHFPFLTPQRGRTDRKP